MLSFIDILNECNYFNTAEFIPIIFGTDILGMIHVDKTHYLTKYKDAFQFNYFDCAQRINSHNRSIIFVPKNEDFDHLTKIFDAIGNELIANGVVADTHGNEMFGISINNFAKPLFAIKRSMVGFWGFRIYGVHLNALVKNKDDWYMWVGERAENRLAGGKWDHLVCGGQPLHLNIKENLAKEAKEEAGISLSLIGKAQAVGATSCRIRIETSLNCYTAFMFDLVLTNNFTPINIDGSVKRFFLISLAELAANPECLLNFKPACYMVIISLLIRYGYIKADHPHYACLCAMLASGFYKDGTMAC